MAGLGLFLFGMEQMSASLKAMAGAGFRRFLGRATRNRWLAALTGGVLGGLIRGTATTVMASGFVNAGLFGLAAAVPVVIGANVGATLSMQLVSFKLIHLAYFAIAIGCLLRVAFRSKQLRMAGQGLLGFGLMFLGLDMMSGAIEPYRDTLQPWLARIDGSHLPGLLLGILLATLLTGIIQSSGAVIGMSFALITAGALTGLHQVYPIILGAHIGTCVTPILGTLGASPDARRVAFSNLGFNLFNVALAVAAAPLFLRAAEASSGDLLRQAANLHTIVHLVAALAALPVLTLFLRGLRLLFRDTEPVQASFLDDALLDFPENALIAMLRELRRIAGLCDQAYGLARGNLFRRDRRTTRRIEGLEQVSDDTMDAFKTYLGQLASRRLSRRQAIFMQHLDDAMVHVERIMDHVEKLNRITQGGDALRNAELSPQAREVVETLSHHTEEMLDCLQQSLDPDDNMDVPSVTLALHASVSEYLMAADTAHDWFSEEMEARRLHPITGLLIKDVIGSHDRIAGHITALAELLGDKEFFVKGSKLKTESVMR